MTTTTDPFGDPGTGSIPDRGDPFGDPGGSFGRDRERGDAEERALVPRDQWDRYRLPHLDGTKPAANKGFTRVSTQKSALSNTFGIQEWQKRKVIDGVGKDPEIVAAAIKVQAMPDGPERERALAKIAERAFVTGGGKERSGLGTEFHEVTEKINRGEMTIADAPERLHRDLHAYYTLLSDNNIKILPQYLERQVLCPHNVAGTFDNIILWWNEITGEWELLVGDLKTGRSLDLAWLEILIQIWNYANAYAMWTTTALTRADDGKITDIEGYYEPMPPELRQDKGLIFHVPLDGTATLYVLDLSGVRTYVEAAVVAKRANAEAKTKVVTAGVFRPEAFVAPAPSSTPLTDQVIPGAYVPAVGGVPAQISPDGGETWQNAGPAQLTGLEDPTERIILSPAASVTWSPEDGTRVDGEHRPAPTPDQLAQEAKAAERLATVSALPPPAEPPPAERDPVTGRKKRTCGFCHRPGHWQKNCPDNPESAKYVPQGSVTDVTPPGTYSETAEDVRGPIVPPGADPAEPASMVISPEGPPLPQSGGPVTLSDQEAAPYCLKQHPDACQWTAAGNQWVCSISGKPGEVAWRKQQTTVTAEPPFYGQPETELNAGPPSYGVIAEAKAQALAQTGQPVPPANWDTPPDMVAWGISQAQTWQALLKHREECKAAGTWNEDYEQQGAERYRVLTTRTDSQ